MLNPRTYNGYDKDGKLVGSCTAVDANTLINPEEVQAQIDNIVKVVDEQMQVISNALENISEDATDAVIVQGTNMSEIISETSSALDSVSGEVKENVQEAYNLSVQAHDKLQEQLNTDAYNTMSSTANVVSVR